MLHNIYEDFHQSVFGLLPIHRKRQCKVVKLLATEGHPALVGKRDHYTTKLDKKKSHQHLPTMKSKSKRVPQAEVKKEKQSKRKQGPDVEVKEKKKHSERHHEEHKEQSAYVQQLPTMLSPCGHCHRPQLLVNVVLEHFQVVDFMLRS